MADGVEALLCGNSNDRDLDNMIVSLEEEKNAEEAWGWEWVAPTFFRSNGGLGFYICLRPERFGLLR